MWPVDPVCFRFVALLRKVPRPAHRPRVDSREVYVSVYGADDDAQRPEHDDGDDVTGRHRMLTQGGHVRHARCRRVGGRRRWKLERMVGCG